MGSIRQPAVAGSFYPGDSARLSEVVERFLGGHLRAKTRAPKAIIAPHAGYDYSGPVAGSVYSLLRNEAANVRSVVLMGPAHRVAIHGLAAPGCEAFDTPIGRVRVDRQSVKALAKRRLISINDPVHQKEHGLEVHLPFLQTIFPDFSMVPLAVGDAKTPAVQAVLNALWGGPETLIVVSSDLSHYYPYNEAQALDEKTAASIEKLEPEAIGSEQACGQIAIQGLLLCARDRGLEARTLDLRNSGDTAGSPHQVVGYGAFIVN